VDNVTDLHRLLHGGLGLGLGLYVVNKEVVEPPDVVAVLLELQSDSVIVLGHFEHLVLFAKHLLHPVVPLKLVEAELHLQEGFVFHNPHRLTKVELLLIRIKGVKVLGMHHEAVVKPPHGILAALWRIHRNCMLGQVYLADRELLTLHVEHATVPLKKRVVHLLLLQHLSLIRCDPDSVADPEAMLLRETFR